MSTNGEIKKKSANLQTKSWTHWALSASSAQVAGREYQKMRL